MTLEEKILVLQATTVFRGLPEPCLERILEGSIVRFLEQGAVLFKAGESLEQVAVLLTGVVRTFRLTNQAREFTLGVHAPRAVLGVLAVFQNAQPLFTAEMLEAGSVLLLDAHVLQKIVTRDVVVAYALLQYAVSRQNALMQRIDDVFFADLNTRVAKILLEHNIADGWLLPKNAVLAAELGTVPELVSRKLGEFYRMGFIRLEKRRVWVINVTALQDLL